MSSTPCTPHIRTWRLSIVEIPDQRGIVINIGAVLATLRKVFAFEMTIAEWIGTGVLAAIPYLVIGVIWALTHIHHPSGPTGFDATVSFLGSIAGWPVLLFSNVCTA